MRTPVTARRRPIRLLLERLESRRLLTAPATLKVPLDPSLDQFGDQVMTVQAYKDAQETRTTFGIFDTGASAVTFSADDQGLFEFQGSAIPIKVAGGAQAAGIGGGITGDVSQPGTILADGFHAAGFGVDDQGFPQFSINLGAGSAQTSGIQAFVGTATGSPDMPTITGTPILGASAEHPNGLAARIDMQGTSIDFGNTPGDPLSGSIPLPDLHFVDPTTALAAATGTTDPVTIPLVFYGDNNQADPGDAITEGSNVVIDGVGVHAATTSASGQHFLFDTGAQLSVISTATAAALGLDLTKPETTIDVQGVGGTETVPGFTLPEIDVPRRDGGVIQLTNIPVYVLDVADGIDGILGMNAFDTASSILFNPFDPAGASVSVTYYTDPQRGGTFDGGGNAGALIAALAKSRSVFGGVFHGKNLPGLKPNSLTTTFSTVDFADATSTVDESAGSATITLTRSAALDKAATVHVSTADGTAHAGSDYAAVSRDVTFAANQATATFTVPIVHRTTAGPALTLNLSLSSSDKTARPGDRATASLTIANHNQAGTVQVAASAVRVNEDAGVATITVTRTGGAASGVTVHYATSDGSARAGVDYRAVSGSLTFGPGETSKAIVVPVLAAGKTGGDVALSVILDAPGGGATLGSSTALVTIHDNAAAPPVDSTPPQGNPPPVTAPTVYLASATASGGSGNSLAQIVLTFSGPIDATAAQQLSHYVLVPLLARRHKGSPFRFGPPKLGADGRTITLTPAGRAGLNNTLLLYLQGLTDSLGRPVDAGHNGQPGSGAILQLTRHHGRPSGHSSVPTVDVVFLTADPAVPPTSGKHSKK